MNNERILDYSHGSTNTYLVEQRHALIPECYQCHEFIPVLLDGTEYYNYFMRGMNIAEACKSLTLDEREVLISGVHPECWDRMFEEEEQEKALSFDVDFLLGEEIDRVYNEERMSEAERYDYSPQFGEEE